MISSFFIEYRNKCKWCNDTWIAKTWRAFTPSWKCSMVQWKKWCEFHTINKRWPCLSKTDKYKFNFASTDHNKSYATYDNKEFQNNNKWGSHWCINEWINIQNSLGSNFFHSTHYAKNLNGKKEVVYRKIMIIFN